MEASRQHGESLPEPGDAQENLPEIIEPEANTKAFAINEAELATHAMERVPEAVIPHVLRAAERNEPLEGQRERKHEKKDEAVPAPMIPIAQVVADIPSRQPALAPLQETKQLSLDEPKEEAVPQFSSFVPSYKQAVVFGIAGGLFICFILAAVFLK